VPRQRTGCSSWDDHELLQRRPGLRPDQQNVLQFHPTHITKVLLPDINASPAGCLNSTDDIFFSGFE
jgi:hypothetical protein